ncbi:MAG TPA: hypothetical protein VFO39_05960 [Candidatus Sulfotelmatobacter sp.]|nr:hypothetical protein [Candidatus Sulfotelmatobacter sp.]
MNVGSSPPFSPEERKTSDEATVKPSRLIDEKISDESGTESKADSALAPTGLNNPFWH